MSEDKSAYDPDIRARIMGQESRERLPIGNQEGTVSDTNIPIMLPMIDPPQEMGAVPPLAESYYGSFIVGQMGERSDAQPILIKSATDAAAKDSATMTAMQAYPAGSGWEKRAAYLVRNPKDGEEKAVLVFWQESTA